MADGMVLLRRVFNDCWSDQRVLSAGSSRARHAHASDVRLFGLSRRRWSATAWVNSSISTIG